MLLLQLDTLRERLASEESAADELRESNARLAQDLRELSKQLKQERAAANAVLSNAALSNVSNAALGSEEEHEATEGGLTLASAASQILMLRREVKWLQKQWNAARRDQQGSARREELETLRARAEAAEEAAASTHARQLSLEAQSRLLLRELSAVRASLAAQQARTAKRSAYQLELAQLRAALHRRPGGDEMLSSAQELVGTQLLRERRLSDWGAYALCATQPVDRAVEAQVLTLEVSALEVSHEAALGAAELQLAKLEREREELIREVGALSHQLTQLESEEAQKPPLEPKQGAGFKFKIGGIGRKTQPSGWP